MLAQTKWKRWSHNGDATRVTGLFPLLLFCLALDAHGLTIYRIGNGPPPGPRLVKGFRRCEPSAGPHKQKVNEKRVRFGLRKGQKVNEQWAVQRLD